MINSYKLNISTILDYNRAAFIPSPFKLKSLRCKECVGHNRFKWYVSQSIGHAQCQSYYHGNTRSDCAALISRRLFDESEAAGR